MIALRSPGEHGRRKQARFRFIRPDGSDAIVDHPYLKTDQTIPVPKALDRIVDTAARLSIVLREPYVRIDLYDIRDRVVLGEVTRRPGGSQWQGPALDRELGERWERARARIARDLAVGQE
jgi:hypothetical protein